MIEKLHDRRLIDSHNGCRVAMKVSNISSNLSIIFEMCCDRHATTEWSEKPREKL